MIPASGGNLLKLRHSVQKKSVADNNMTTPGSPPPPPNYYTQDAVTE